MCTRVYGGLYIHIHIHKHEHTHTHTRVHMHILTQAHTHTHTYTHTCEHVLPVCEWAGQWRVAVLSVSAVITSMYK